MPAQGAAGSCERALVAGRAAFKPTRTAWRAASAGGRQLRDFRKLATAAEMRTLASFDGELDSLGSCGDERSALEALIAREVWTTFLVQRRLLEEDVAGSLSGRLLLGMQRRGEPLRVQEKVDMLREAVASYGSRVKRLLPTAAEYDPELAQVEQRLGELQFGIEASAKGRAVLWNLEQRRQKRLLKKRAHGVAVSLDPGLRVMLRPEGLGNLQIFSEGPVGPPNMPGLVKVGIMNDGSIADVYREHPVPPKIAVQPAVKVNLNLG